MRKLIWGAFTFAALTACQENEDVKTEFTGNETVYALQQASDYPIYGTVTFKEKLDGTAEVLVDLSGTEGAIEHPVHLHMGHISQPDAEVAALLNPVIGSTGESRTELTRLADETEITYSQLVSLNACVKIHLAASGADRDIILAGGNVGTAVSDAANGRAGIAVCK